MLSLIISQIQLRAVDTLIIAIFMLVVQGSASFVLPKLGYEWCALRRVAALDVIDESIRICAEKGRPFFQYLGQGTFGGKFVIYTESHLALARYLTKRCGELGIRYIAACSDAQLALALTDFTKQGYIEAGRPEMFNTRDVRYVTAGFAQMMFEAIDTIRNDKPGTLIAIGHIGGGTPIAIFQEATRLGTFVIGSSESPDEMAQAAMTADYTMTNEEQVIVGSYIDNDPEKMAVFVGEDVIKLVMVGIIIVTGIAWMLGVRIFG